MSAKNVVEFCLVCSSTRRRFFPQVLWGDKRRAVVRIGQRAVCGGGTGHAKIIRGIPNTGAVACEGFGPGRFEP